MGTTWLAMLRLMSSWPVVGTHCRGKIAEHLLDAVNTVEANFNSKTIRFADNLAGLYHHLQGYVYPELEEDFHLYRTLQLSTFSKTSGEAYRLLERIKEEGGPPDFEPYFRDGLPGASRPLMDWYSNQQTLEGFITEGILLLKRYTEVNLRTDGGTEFTDQGPRVTYATLEFFKTRYLKYLVLDLINALRLVLDLEVRATYVKERKGT